MQVDTNAFTGTGWALYQQKWTGSHLDPIPGFDQPPTFEDKDKYLETFNDYDNWSNLEIILCPTCAYYNESTQQVVCENYRDEDWQPLPDYPGSFNDFIAGISWQANFMVELFYLKSMSTIFV